MKKAPLFLHCLPGPHWYGYKEISLAYFFSELQLHNDEKLKTISAETPDPKRLCNIKGKKQQPEELPKTFMQRVQQLQRHHRIWHRPTKTLLSNAREIPKS